MLSLLVLDENKVSSTGFIANTFPRFVPLGLAIVRLRQTFAPRHIFIGRDTVETAGCAGAPVLLAFVPAAAARLVHACAPAFILRAS